MNILIFDTETISVTKPFCYNIGYCIYNIDEQKVLLQKDFVVSQVWDNKMLFETAYFAEKKQIYINRMRGKSVIQKYYGNIQSELAKDIENYEVAGGYAYNSPFDIRVFEFNSEWYKCKNAIENLPIYDIRAYITTAIQEGKIPDYIEFCKVNDLFTDTGGVSTTADSLYKFLRQDMSVQEEHTALADSLLELEILKYGLQFYPLDFQATAPKIVLPPTAIHTFTVETNGEKFTFPYRQKVKTSKFDGVILK